MGKGKGEGAHDEDAIVALDILGPNRGGALRHSTNSEARSGALS